MLVTASSQVAGQWQVVRACLSHSCLSRRSKVRCYCPSQGCLSWQVVNGNLSTETAPARSTGLLRCGIDAASHHRQRIETPDAVGCITSTATMRCDDDVGSPEARYLIASVSGPIQCQAELYTKYKIW